MNWRRWARASPPPAASKRSSTRSRRRLRRPTAGRAVARESADAGGSACVCPADIREEEQVREAVRAALGQFGRLDFLVNNAGGQFFAPLEAISAKGWDTVVRTNLNGGFLMARETYT